MSRDRHQDGHVEETGKRTKKWKGHYYVYERDAAGKEIKRHRAVILGLKSKMKKHEAHEALRGMIQRDTTAAGIPAALPATLEWFWKERYRPIKEASWRASSAPKTVWFIENYVVKPFAAVLLSSLSRFDLQKHLNGLAVTFSESTVKKFRVYMKALLDEALEQDFITKNPARKLEIPADLRQPEKRTLSVDEIALLLAGMEGRDRLVVRMAIVLGLRPGELFALRRNDVGPNFLRIDESNSAISGIGKTKTASSAARVWVPRSLAVELTFWLDVMVRREPESFLFATAAGTPIATHNFLVRSLKKAAAGAGLAGVTFRALRRTCATQMQQDGNVKDIQAHLRHARPDVTAGVYMQAIPASVAAAVEALDERLSRQRAGDSITINH